MECGSKEPRPGGSRKNARWRFAEAAKPEERVEANVGSGSGWDQYAWGARVEHTVDVVRGAGFGEPVGVVGAGACGLLELDVGTQTVARIVGWVNWLQPNGRVFGKEFEQEAEWSRLAMNVEGA